jgi:hypothetical protein
LPIHYNKNLTGKFAVISNIQEHVFTVSLLTLPARFFSVRLLPTFILSGQRFSIAGGTQQLHWLLMIQNQWRGSLNGPLWLPGKPNYQRDSLTGRVARFCRTAGSQFAQAFTLVPDD